MKFSFVPQTFFRFFFLQDKDQDHDQVQHFTMTFINKIFALYNQDTHQIWCGSAKVLWKWNFVQDHDFTLDLNTRRTFYT